MIMIECDDDEHEVICWNKSVVKTLLQRGEWNEEIILNSNDFHGECLDGIFIWLPVCDACLSYLRMCKVVRSRWFFNITFNGWVNLKCYVLNKKFQFPKGVKWLPDKLVCWLNYCLKFARNNNRRHSCAFISRYILSHLSSRSKAFESICKTKKRSDHEGKKEHSKRLFWRRC